MLSWGSACVGDVKTGGSSGLYMVGTVTATVH